MLLSSQLAYLVLQDAAVDRIYYLGPDAVLHAFLHASSLFCLSGKGLLPRQMKFRLHYSLVKLLDVMLW